jgi:tRNA (5-methylaminomethyl-2-thiouridylate)-methyltransferase
VDYAVLLSGGVDSSTALMEIVRGSQSAGAGGTVVAYYLKVWLEDELESLGDCPWEEDLGFARAVCEMAGVRLEVVSLQLEYYDRVVSYAVDELRRGRTPSPDIFCNQRIKFGAFLDHLATRRDSHRPTIITGHYARITEEGDHVLLRRAPDPVKDQTYFLAHLGQDQLQRVRFPLGGFTKPEVRELAHRYDLPNKDRPDSQGICFLGKVRYPDFIRHYLGERKGDIVEAGSGTLLGEHRGYWFYTIGQRQGLGLSGGPWYVVGKDLESNAILVSHGNAVAARARREFEVEMLSWTWRPPETDRVLVKIRHGPALTPARIEPVPGVDGSARGAGSAGGPDRLRVIMDSEDRGVASGQYAVFYDEDICLGCGRIRLPEDQS